MSRFERLPGIDSEMSDEEAEFILNRLNSAFVKGPSNFHELTPEYWEKMQERRRAYQESKRNKLDKRVDE